MRPEHWWYTLPLRLLSLFRERAADRDLDDEMQYHMERLAEENMARGMPAAEARLAALRAMDSLTQNKERARETRRVRGIPSIVRNLRNALRLLRKSTLLSLVTILTLGL